MKRQINKNFIKKCKNIKLVITDVDGVLTDGGMYYSSKGEALKKFNTRDSMGMELLRQINIPTILMTRENSIIVKKRALKMKTDLYMNIKNKKKLLPIICKKYKVEVNNIAYIGDDVNDLEIMKSIGLSVSPADSIEEIKLISNYICELKGGEGAFREFANLIYYSNLK